MDDWHHATMALVLQSSRERKRLTAGLKRWMKKKLLNYWMIKIVRTHRKPQREIAWFFKHIFRRKTSKILKQYICCELCILLQNSIKYIFIVFSKALEIFWMNNKTIEFGFCTCEELWKSRRALSAAAEHPPQSS